MKYLFDKNSYKTNKTKLITIALFLTTLSVAFFINKESQRKSEIRKVTAHTHISYMKQFSKDNPDIVPIIQRQKECLMGKVKPVEGCEVYIYKGVTPQQKLRFEAYLNEIKKIKDEFKRKINN